MTTNRDWLFSLPLEEQLAWMNAEHQEPNPDCSAMLYKMFTENMKQEPCSHYKPKDDAVSIMRECAETGHSMRVLRGRLGVECVTGWQARCLGKLADMVERDYVRRESIEEVMDNDRALVEENSMLAGELLKLRAELEKATNNLNSANKDFENARAELTAERDKLQELNEYHALQYELASEDCDRLQAQVDELTAERDNLKANNEQLHILAGEQAATIDELQKQVDELANAGRKMSTELANMQDYITKVRAEREHYREKCSKMATIIHDALMVMDEGMA